MFKIASDGGFDFKALSNSSVISKFSLELLDCDLALQITVKGDEDGADSSLRQVPDNAKSRGWIVKDDSVLCGFLL